VDSHLHCRALRFAGLRIVRSCHSQGHYAAGHSTGVQPFSSCLSRHFRSDNVSRNPLDCSMNSIDEPGGWKCGNWALDVTYGMKGGKT
jgi:hypothetical protein